MKISKVISSGWKNAIIGMRFPKNSENKSDSNFSEKEPKIGIKDLELCKKLIKAGSDHRKFLRMIHAQMAVEMPLSWWIQFDQHKIGTVTNSRSRMHKFGERLLTTDDFEMEDHTDADYIIYSTILENINNYIELYKHHKSRNEINKSNYYWKKAVSILPVSFLQERMLDINYEAMLKIYKIRHNEKLSKEWNFFIKETKQSLPYIKIFYFA